MDVQQWWPRLDPSTQDWLIAHNGEVVPPDVVGRIVAAGADAGGIGQRVTGGILLPDETTDWIEALANGEDPSDPV